MLKCLWKVCIFPKYPQGRLMHTWLVPDDTVHLSHNLPSFFTLGSLTFDTEIDSYIVNLFISSFLYLTIHVSAGPYRNHHWLLWGLHLTTTESTRGRRNYVGRYGATFWGDRFKLETASSKMTIWFTHPLRHGRDNIKTVHPPPNQKPPCPWGLNFRTYNIRYA